MTLHSVRSRASSRAPHRWPIQPGQTLAAVTGVIVVALLVASCGSDAEPETEVKPSPSASEPTPTAGDPEPTAPADPEADPTATVEPAPPTATPAPTPSPEPDADGAAPDEDAEVVFALFVTGGFVPVDVALSEFPQLVVMSDGTTWLASGDPAAVPVPLAPALDRLTLTLDDVAAIEDAVDRSGVISPDTDFGQPNVTDTPFTSVTGRVGDSAVAVEAYGLGFDQGLDARAREARAALTDLIDTVTGIVDARASTATPARPPALAVLAFPGLRFQENDTVKPWPIASVPAPAPPGADCVVVTGAEMDTLWDAVADATTQTPWNIGGSTTAVALRPVFPHETFC